MSNTLSNTSESLDEETLTSWSQFRECLERLRSNYGERSCDNQATRNTLLFRGQATSEWKLETSLERFINKNFSIQKYVSLAVECKHHIEEFTERNWNIDSPDKLLSDIKQKQTSSRILSLPRPDYLVYLRHHGFPSPLLDWTTSPYIAAYFAYSEQIPRDVERVAIYLFVESTTGVTGSFGENPPLINSIGPYVGAHKRHFAQKARYTFATKWDGNSNTRIFHPHKAIVNRGFNNRYILVKITLPAKDRLIALRELSEDYNIDHFTLFQSEDALAKSLAMKEFFWDDLHVSTQQKQALSN